MIRLTDAAAKRIKEMLEQEETPNLFLRIGVREGGCSGLSYGMGFDDSKSESDTEFDIQGIRVVVDERSSRYLYGLEIDYEETSMGGGFSLHNPNAIATCGCGQSFRTKDDAGKPAEC